MTKQRIRTQILTPLLIFIPEFGGSNYVYRVDA
jgi:hypothetical protein